MATLQAMSTFLLLFLFFIDFITAAVPTSNPTKSPIITKEEKENDSVEQDLKHYLHKYPYIWVFMGILIICCVGNLIVICCRNRTDNTLPKQNEDQTSDIKESYTITTEHVNDEQLQLDDQNISLAKHSISSQFNMNELVPKDKPDLMTVSSNESRLTALSTTSIRFSAYDQTASIVKNQSSQKLLVQPTKHRGLITCIGCSVYMFLHTLLGSEIEIMLGYGGKTDTNGVKETSDEKQDSQHGGRVDV